MTPSFDNPDKFISPEQQGILFNLMAIRFPEGGDRPYGWSRFNRHFIVNSYKNLPADKFAQACCYIPVMPDKEVKTLPAPDLSTLIPRLEWTRPDPIMSCITQGMNYLYRWRKERSDRERRLDNNNCD